MKRRSGWVTGRVLNPIGSRRLVAALAPAQVHTNGGSIRARALAVEPRMDRALPILAGRYRVSWRGVGTLPVLLRRKTDNVTGFDLQVASTLNTQIRARDNIHICSLNFQSLPWIITRPSRSPSWAGMAGASGTTIVGKGTEQGRSNGRTFERSRVRGEGGGR